MSKIAVERIRNAEGTRRDVYCTVINVKDEELLPWSQGLYDIDFQFFRGFLYLADIASVILKVFAGR